MDGKETGLSDGWNNGQTRKKQILRKVEGKGTELA